MRAVDEKQDIKLLGPNRETNICGQSTAGDLVVFKSEACDKEPFIQQDPPRDPARLSLTGSDAAPSSSQGLAGLGGPGNEAIASGGGGDMDIEEGLKFELCLEDSKDLVSLNEELNRILDPTNNLRTPPPSIDLSPLECHALQREEIDTIQAIYDSDVTALNEDGTCFVIQIKYLSDEIKDEDVIKIWFSLPPSYPCVPPVFEIEANKSGSFSYNDADELFELLMTESFMRIGGMMVFDLVTIAQDYMPALVERKCELASKQEAADRERKKVMELEEALRDGCNRRGVPRELVGVFASEELKNHAGEEEGQATADKADEGAREQWSKAYGSYGFDKPHHFIGSISEIVKKLPPGLQISRIENIMRSDLADRFKTCMKTMTSSLWQQERKYPHMYNLKPQIAFHGTRTHSLPSIVHKGLVIPGMGNEVKVRSGSSLGVGIYLSPNPEFSLNYSDTWDRLIVCAALLGRMYKGSYDRFQEAYSRFHTLMHGDEWVFFNAAQVLPCFVIQIHQGTKRNTASSNPPPLASSILQQQTKEDEDVSKTEREKQKKLKLLARARKFLPYGFGPGGKTVIEDAASFDDDEEDYGDFQMMRYADSDTRSTHDGVIKEQSELQKYRYKDAYERTHSIEQPEKDK